MKKVVSKGYTLEVVSWENDGDNYRTKFYTVDTKEEAFALYKMCTVLFKSCTNNEGGVGNSNKYDDEDIEETINKYYETYKELYPKLDIEDIDALEYYTDDIAYSLMGFSKYYDYKVCESCTVTYSPEDIYLEEITFDNK